MCGTCWLGLLAGRSRSHKIETGPRAGSPYAPKLGLGEGGAMAHIEVPRARSWRDVLWLLMTVLGMLLIVCAALSV